MSSCFAGHKLEQYSFDRNEIDWGGILVGSWILSSIDGMGWECVSVSVFSACSVSGNVSGVKKLCRVSSYY